LSQNQSPTGELWKIQKNPSVEGCGAKGIPHILKQ
jgi:hypothetical protein